MDRLDRRCSCGSRRRPVRRLARRALRTVLAGFVFTGLSTAGCPAPQLASASRWIATLDLTAPCCPRALLALGEPHSAR
jgi:hypothetical protein